MLRNKIFKFIVIGLISSMTMSCERDGYLIDFMEDTKVTNFLDIVENYEDTKQYTATVNDSNYYIKDHDDFVINIIANSDCKEISREEYDENESIYNTSFWLVLKFSGDIFKQLVGKIRIASLFIAQYHTLYLSLM